MKTNRYLSAFRHDLIYNISKTLSALLVAAFVNVVLQVNNFNVLKMLFSIVRRSDASHHSEKYGSQRSLSGCLTEDSRVELTFKITLTKSSM